MKRILVIGGGFAGLWSAVSAARRIRELGVEAEAEITLVNSDENHSIRVRNYEEDLASTLVPLSVVLDPINVRIVIGRTTTINTAGHYAEILTRDSVIERFPYDKLILATGSQLHRPPIPGLAEHAFDVDTYAAAKRLQDHINALPSRPSAPGLFTALVVGSGATGVEIAAELPARLAAAARAHNSADNEVRVILLDRTPHVASQLGGAQPVIEQASKELGIELMANSTLTQLTATEAILNNEMRIPTATVVWCAGMKASPLAQSVSTQLDNQGRLFVDPYLRVTGVDDVFAAGDVAHMLVDGVNPSIMSCQHARPMGRYAGNNAACELFDQSLSELGIDWYTNIIDLGPWGAVYTETYDRVVKADRAAAKNTKTVINRQRIYPPTNGNRDEILAAGSLDLQRPPSLGK